MAKKMENVADIYPLTPTQMGMLYHVLSEPGSEVYFGQIRCTLEGPLDVEKLIAAWQFVFDHHPALRTAFFWEELESPLQIVRQIVSLPWDLLDWRDDEKTSLDLDNLAAQYRQSAFDLAKAPLANLVLVRLADEVAHFIWNSHHLILDGWSTHQVFHEAFSVYEMLVRGQDPFLPPVEPFRNYLAWLKKQDLETAEKFWREKLSGFAVPTKLPERGDESKTGIAYGEVKKTFSANTSAALKQFSQKGRITLNTLVQGAWALLLSTYSGERDVVFGNTLSGRPATISGVEQMVGMFITTLPLRVRLQESEFLLPWLQQLQEEHLAVREFEYTPLFKVQQWSEVPNGQSLFESIIVFENYPVESEAGDNSIHIQDFYFREQSNYPLALLVLPGDRLHILAIYNRNRFEAKTIELLVDHLQIILESMMENPRQRVGDISLLTSAEKELILHKWHTTADLILEPKFLHAYIEDHALRSPQAPAVVAADQSLSYDELNTRANNLAHHLTGRGVKPGTPVGLFVERSMEMVIGIVGILKAGGAYVPLEPSYPPERIAYAMADTAAPLIVTQRHLVQDIPASEADIITLDESLSISPAATPITSLTMDDPAYIIHTSGSTGTPKGVVVTHRNLLASTIARDAYYDAPVERFLLLSSFAFDSSVAGIFWTLAGGGTLVLPATDDEKDVYKLASIISLERVTHTLALPSLYRLLLAYAPDNSLDSLEVVIVAGEACPPDLGQLHYRHLPQTLLYNEYGPTEATVWCTVHRLSPLKDGLPVPIGRPIPGTRIYILDRRRQPVPIGVPGELYIGGAGVTPGYLNNPGLTAERFLELDITENEKRDRVYRTGDLARWRPDGEIEFLGRVDSQVKIRGFRVEPGEIETRLLDHPHVREAAVTTWYDPGNKSAAQKTLLAYVVLEAQKDGEPITVAELQTYLSRLLPEYMLPRQVSILPSLPRTPNGKLDRSRLPAPQTAQDKESQFIAPRNGLEKKLAAVWSDILAVPQVGVEDNFFELGGDSMTVIRLVAAARKAGINITPRQLLQEPTIAGLAAASAADDAPEEMTGMDANPILLPVNKGGTRPPFFFLHGVFGDVRSLTNLIPEFDSDQPVYGLQAIGLNRDLEPDRTFEEMATRYIEVLQKVQPSGPYYLGGFCFGGVLAYEVAWQLEQLGEEIAFLAVIEGTAPREFHKQTSFFDSQRLRITWNSAAYWFNGYEEFGGRYLGARLKAKLTGGQAPGVYSNGRSSQNLEFDDMADFDTYRPEIQFRLREVNKAASIAYVPKPINGHVTLFRAQHLNLGHAFSVLDPERGWGNLAKGGVTIRYVNGTHWSMLEKPHAIQLARELQKALDEVAIG